MRRSAAQASIGSALPVPGSVSLTGLAKLVGTYSAAGITDIFGAIGAIFATTFRILCGRVVHLTG